MPVDLCAGTAVQDIKEREAVHNFHDSACPGRKDKALQTTSSTLNPLSTLANTHNHRVALQVLFCGKCACCFVELSADRSKPEKSRRISQSCYV